MAITWLDGTSEYMAWRHPEGNNCTREDAQITLDTIWQADVDILTHNGCVFDIPVLQHWFGLPQLDPMRVHDTLYLAYLNNPHARSLSLKDLANDLLGIAPDEQRDLQDWILANTECKTRSKCGGYISRAPTSLVGPYAIGDVERTLAVWEYLRGLVLPKMQGAYDRERRLAPILVGMQNTGVRLAVEKLQADAASACEELELLDQKLHDLLNVANLDSDDALVQGLQAAGHTGFTLTEKGKLSTAKGSLDIVLADDPGLRTMLSRRSELATLTRTFMLPWLEQSAATGRIYPAYNAVRNPDGYGTRTGRLSSSQPNLTNVPPTMKQYVLPELGHDWVSGDFSSQEPRLTAHFAEGALLATYQRNPAEDIYTWIAGLANVSRKHAKTVFLGLLYGMGAGKLGESLGISQAEATALRDQIKRALPEVAALSADVTKRFRLGQSITTLGGRVYHCEPSKDGREFSYKALNVLVQGSAADMAKEAMIYVQSKLLRGERIVGMVHDSIEVSCRPGRTKVVMQILRDSALALPCDAPMLMSTGEGATWGEVK
jgi:DNA polymerase-1